jgi:RNA polymerase sigma-70 factor (ECF subfamily)
MGNENKYEGLDEYAVRLIKHKARQLVGRAGFVEADRHDLEQELVIDLLRRLPRFDPAIAKRETFITRIVQHHIATIIESQKAGIRDYRQHAGSIDERREEDDGSSADSPPVLNQDEYLRETLTSARRDEDLHALRLDIEKVLSELLPSDSSIDLRALCARLQTSSVTDVSRETGVPRGTVYEAIQKLRTRFERAGLSIYLEGSDRKRRPPVGNR